jgi:HD-GYP domain-containing protein (c-di-GMP phosphodiesterase class II)
LSDEQLGEVYYAVLLKDLGCSSNAARIAEIYLTDDRVFKHAFKRVDGSLRQTLGFVFAQTGRGKPWRMRLAAIANILRNGPRIARDLIETRCTRGADIARRLRFSEGVATAIAHLDEHWDGAGKPWGVAGHDIPLAARIALLAQVVDVYFMADGPEAARAEVARRSGSWLDPVLAKAFLALSLYPQFWRMLGSNEIHAYALEMEPASLRIGADESYLDDIAAAFGLVIDAKSPFTNGRAERMAYYCDAVAERLGQPPERRRAIRRAAMLHDIGMLGISSAILEKPGPLDARETVIMHMHADLTIEILEHVPAFSDIAAIAGAHHERLDGRGYPLGAAAVMIPLATRIITACGMFDALVSARPHRPAFTPEQALEMLGAEIGGAVDEACFAALGLVVLHAMPAASPPEICV